LILLTLIGIKFVRVFSSAHKQDSAGSSPATATTVATNQPTAETKP
jgi:hypothetical protein